MEPEHAEGDRPDQQRHGQHRDGDEPPKLLPFQPDAPPPSNDERRHAEHRSRHERERERGSQRLQAGAILVTTMGFSTSTSPRAPAH